MSIAAISVHTFCRFGMVQAFVYSLGHVCEEGGSGVLWSKAMLCGGEGNVRGYVLKDEPLEYLGGIA